MADIIKIGVLGVAGAMLAVSFKSIKPEYATYICLGISVLIMGHVIEAFKDVVSNMEALKQYFSGTESYLTVLVKVIGITYICEFCAGICKDAGYGNMADQIEMLGKLFVMFAGIPIIMAVIHSLDDLIVH